MEKLLLGLLMFRRLTAYELHMMIKINYQGICSSSIGNIQRALKKLLQEGLVTYDQQAKSNKKIHSITADGRTAFLNWLREPLNISKANNMEFGKMLLLGYLSEEQQLENINNAVSILEAEYEYLLEVEKWAQLYDYDARVAYVKQNKEYVAELLEQVHGHDINDVLVRVDKFCKLTLQLALDTVKFNLEWFKNLKLRMVEGN